MQEASAEPDPRFSATWAVPAVLGAASVIEPVPCDQVEASVGEEATDAENDPLVPGFWTRLPTATAVFARAEPVQLSALLPIQPVPFQYIAVTGKRRASR